MGFLWWGKKTSRGKKGIEFIKLVQAKSAGRSKDTVITLMLNCGINSRYKVSFNGKQNFLTDLICENHLLYYQWSLPAVPGLKKK